MRETGPGERRSGHGAPAAGGSLCLRNMRPELRGAEKTVQGSEAETPGRREAEHGATPPSLRVRPRRAGRRRASVTDGRDLRKHLREQGVKVREQQRGVMRGNPSERGKEGQVEEKRRN